MDGTTRVIAVGRNRRNLKLVSDLLSREGYPTVTATTLEQLDRILETVADVDLVLFDIGGFDRRIWDRAERLRKEGIPFVVISPRRGPTATQEGMAHGASSVLSKPLGKDELLAIVRGLVKER